MNYIHLYDIIVGTIHIYIYTLPVWQILKLVNLTISYDMDYQTRCITK